MAKIHGGEMVVRALEREGVRELFTLAGEHIDPILEAAAAHGFRIIDTRHEQAAGPRAEGWAATSGRPGVAGGAAPSWGTRRGARGRSPRGPSCGPSPSGRDPPSSRTASPSSSRSPIARR